MSLDCGIVGLPNVGKSTIPTFGSIVQKGKFSAAAGAAVRAENIVDLPTFGNPTIPQSKDIKFLKN